MAEVAKVVHGDYDDVLLVVEKQNETVKGQKERGGWRVWEQARLHFGETTLRAMVQLKTIQMQPNPAVAGAGLEYPQDQMFYISQSTTVNDKMFRQTTQLKGGASLDSDTGSQVDNIMSSASSSDAPRLQSMPGLLIEPQHTPEEQKGPHKLTVEALQGIRSTHASWEKKAREMKATKALAAANEVTKDSWFHQRLIKQLEEGEKMDQSLLSYEIGFANLLRDAPAKEDVQEAARLCAELLKIAQKASKSASSLKSMMKNSEDA